MKTSQLIFLLIIFPCFINAQENGGFEAWDNLHTHTYPDEMSMNNIPDVISGLPTKWKSEYDIGVARTTDAYSGEYSLVIHNWYNYANESISYKKAIQNIPNTISGYYKYIADENDGIYPTGLGKVVITDSNEDTISLTNFTLDTTSVYQYFEFNLEQTNHQPDSIEIIFTNAENNYSCTGLTINVCNFLYLDNIELSFTTGIISLNDLSDNLITSYPNPATEYINFDIDKDEFHVEVYDMTGELLLIDKNNKRLNVSELPTGLYFVRIYDEDFKVVGTNRFLKKY